MDADRTLSGQTKPCGAAAPSCHDPERPNPPDGPYICIERGPHDVHTCRAHGCRWPADKISLPRICEIPACGCTGEAHP